MKTDHGFTIIEMLVAVFLSSVVVFGVGFLGYFVINNIAFTVNTGSGTDQVRYALLRMTSEIRKLQPSDNGSYPLVTVDNNNLIFYANVTGDSRTERVRYTLSGSQIIRGIIQPTQNPITYPTANETTSVLVENVVATSSALFTYYNGDWPSDTVANPLVQGDRLLQSRLVTIQFSISENGEETPAQATVMLRSLKDNL